MNVNRISRIAGITIAGFVVASVTADKANLGPVAAQAAGFVGAFAGTLLAHVRGRNRNGANFPKPPAEDTGSRDALHPE